MEQNTPLPPLCDDCRGIPLFSTVRQYARSAGIPLFEDLLNSNRVPSDTEANSLRGEFIDPIDADVLRIEHRMTGLREKLEILEDERHALLVAQTHYLIPFSPVRRLPAEILNEIFSQVVRVPVEAEADKKPWSRDPAAHPLTPILLVCSLWRSVALEHSRLWAEINAKFPLPSSALVPRYHLGVAQDIARSRSRALDVYIGCDWAFYPEHYSLHYRPVADAVFSQQTRWRCAWLGLEPHVIQLLLGDSLPLLESLILELPHDSNHLQVVAFQGCPRLSSLTINGGLCDLQFPWHQLTYLNLYVDYWDDAAYATYRSILERCIILRTLDVAVPDSGFDAPQNAHNAPLTSPITSIQSSFVFLYRILVLPSLTKIKAWVEGDADDLFLAMLDLLERSSCYDNLTYLFCGKHAHTSSGEEHTLLLALRLTRNLEFLSFACGREYCVRFPAAPQNEQGYDEEVVQIVCSLAETDSFLPCLQSVHLQVTEHTNRRIFPYFGSSGALLDTLRQRWNGGTRSGTTSRLELFHFEISAQSISPNFSRSLANMIIEYEYALLTKDDRVGLEALRSEGMRIYISVNVPSVFDTQPPGLEVGTLDEVSNDRYGWDEFCSDS